MAEDEIVDIEDLEETVEDVEEGVGYPPPRPQEHRKRDACLCNTRIDELSTPPKRIFLALYKEHGHHLPKDKVNHLKELLQQLYAMSPEETAKYFAELRAEAKIAAQRKKLKQKLRKYLKDKHNQKQRKRAFKLFKKLLKCGISYAVENPVPPLVSIRLRYLSDIILEQLCDMRKLEVPNRANPDRLGNFMISVADWMAIAVERLYYAAQMSINEITNQEEMRFEDFQPPVASSPRGSFDPGQTTANSTMQDTHTFGEPIATSTPQGSKTFGEPLAASTPQGSRTFGKPLAASTPQGSRTFGKPVAASTPQGSRTFGKPVAASTPKGSLDFTKPGASSTPRGSLDAQQAKKKSEVPFYSLLADETTINMTNKTSKLSNKVPYYTFSHMKPNVNPAWDKTLVEMPPYGFRNVSASDKNKTVGGTAKKRTKSSKQQLNKTK